MSDSIKPPGMEPISGNKSARFTYASSIGNLSRRTVKFIGKILLYLVEKVKRVWSKFYASKADASPEAPTKKHHVSVRSPPLSTEDSSSDRPYIETHWRQTKLELSIKNQKNSLKKTPPKVPERGIEIEEIPPPPPPRDASEAPPIIPKRKPKVEKVPPPPPPRELNEIPPKVPDRKEGDDDLGTPPEVPERAPAVPERDTAVDSPGEPPAPPPRDVIIDNTTQDLFALAMRNRRAALRETSPKADPSLYEAKAEPKVPVTEKTEPSPPVARPPINFSGKKLSKQLSKLKKTESQTKLQDKTGGLENKEMLEKTKKTPEIEPEPLRDESEWD